MLCEIWMALVSLIFLSSVELDTQDRIIFLINWHVCKYCLQWKKLFFNDQTIVPFKVAILAT